MEPGLIVETWRWVISAPADWPRVAMLCALGGIVLGWMWLRLRWLREHQSFIRSATPDQLDAYRSSPQLQSDAEKQLRPPGNAPLVLLIGAFCLFSLTEREPVYAAHKHDDEITTASTVRNCCKECDPPSRCNRCKCEAQTVKPPKVQPQRNERFTSAPVPPLQSWRDEPVLHDERWRRYLPES